MGGPRYRAPAPGALRSEVLDDLVILFDRRSGITHVVDEPVPQLLALLGGGWIGVDGLLDRLAETYDLPDASRAALVARLDELAEAGLVERR